MLTIICGEDNIASRAYLNQLKDSYINKNYEIREIQAKDITELTHQILDSPSLFANQCVYITENLQKKLSRKSNKSVFESIEAFVNKEGVLIDWEDSVSAREIKFKKYTILKEFKLSQSIFKLLDACYPENLSNFLRILDLIVENNDEIFIFTMLSRHIKNLVSVKSNATGNKLQKWQIYKLENQARHWTLKNLISFYDALFRIDLNQKTGKYPLSLKKALDLLVCYYL